MLCWPWRHADTYLIHKSSESLACNRWAKFRSSHNTRRIRVQNLPFAANLYFQILEVSVPPKSIKKILTNVFLKENALSNLRKRWYKTAGCEILSFCVGGRRIRYFRWQLSRLLDNPIDSWIPRSLLQSCKTRSKTLTIHRILVFRKSRSMLVFKSGGLSSRGITWCPSFSTSATTCEIPPEGMNNEIVADRPLRKFIKKKEP